MTNKVSATVPSANPADPPRRGRGRPCRDATVTGRADILRHAFRAFAQNGYDNLSLRALADQCGVSDSLITHHFGSKEQLWREAADSVFAPLCARLVAALDAWTVPGGDAVAVLQQHLPQSIKLVANDPVALQFLFREGEGSDARGEYLREKYLRPYLARLDLLFAQAQQTGRFRHASAASRHALVLGLLRSLVIPGLLSAELEPHLATPAGISAYIDDAVAVLYDGLALAPHEQEHLSAYREPSSRS